MSDQRNRPLKETSHFFFSIRWPALATDTLVQSDLKTIDRTAVIAETRLALAPTMVLLPTIGSRFAI